MPHNHRTCILSSALEFSLFRALDSLFLASYLFLTSRKKVEGAFSNFTGCKKQIDCHAADRFNRGRGKRARCLTTRFWSKSYLSAIELASLVRSCSWLFITSRLACSLLCSACFSFKLLLHASFSALALSACLDRKNLRHSKCITGNEIKEQEL